MQSSARRATATRALGRRGASRQGRGGRSEEHDTRTELLAEGERRRARATQGAGRVDPAHGIASGRQERGTNGEERLRIEGQRAPADDQHDPGPPVDPDLARLQIDLVRSEKTAEADLPATPLILPVNRVA